MKRSCHLKRRSSRTQFLTFVNKRLQRFLPRRFRNAGAAILASLLTLSTAWMSAQDPPIYGRTRAFDESHSQAERQGGQTGSLLGGELINLLQKKNGCF